ncbi:MAG: NAD(P)/FAD-dependent oxidoreductase [Candidatus Parabeggiatoa sp. nov. 1]|nr:MAG: NAD(P)/FAD-dependent oxidoreductase [Gammaproteobacteria bacterium]
MASHITVVGGGPAGIATTLALIDKGFVVTLIERSDYHDTRVGEHLLPGALPYLEQLGLRTTVQNGEHRPCQGVRSAWGDSALYDNAYIFNSYGNGLNLSRPSFDKRLAEQAKQRGATVLIGTSVRSFTQNKDGWLLKLSGDQNNLTLQTHFIIEATGRKAAVARALKQERIAYDKLVGIVGFLPPLSSNTSVDDSILLEACEDGWWYSALLFDGQVVAAYMTDADLLSKSSDKPLDFWRKQVEPTTHIKARLEEFELATQVQVKPAQSQRLAKIVGEGWLAVGDAAISFDPLSSGGITKGLSGGLRAAEAIFSHFNGEADALSLYETEIKQAFEDYLSTRANYYRMEARWPASPFWQRRHQPLPSEIPVMLDPMSVVFAPKTVQPKQVGLFLQDKMLEIDSDLITQLARQSKPAHQLVSQFKTESEHQHDDQEIIIAVQLLLQEGLFMNEGAK